MRGGQLAFLLGRGTLHNFQQKCDVGLGHILRTSCRKSRTLSGFANEKPLEASQTSTLSLAFNWTIKASGGALPEMEDLNSVAPTCVENGNCCQSQIGSFAFHKQAVSLVGPISIAQAKGPSVTSLHDQLSGCRLFASQAAPKRGGNRKASRNRSSQGSATTTPCNPSQLSEKQVDLTFEDCLRKLAPLIDDLESQRASWTNQRNFDIMLTTNAQSSGKLLQFLDSILPQANGFPKATSYPLIFFVMDGESIRKVRLYFRTTGGDCRKQVQDAFQGFFQECGIAKKFRWSPGSWGALHITGRESEHELREKARMIRRSHESDDSSPSEENASIGATQESSSRAEDNVSLSHVDRPRDHGPDGDLHAAEKGVSIESKKEALTEGHESVSASNDRYGEHGSIFSTPEARREETEEGVTSIEELIHSLDPALKLIAEQAWGNHDEATSKGVLEMLDSLTNSSPLLGETISEKIWKGRISLEDVCEGLDQRDVNIATSIVFHTHRLIEQQGRPTSWNGA